MAAGVARARLRLCEHAQGGMHALCARLPGAMPQLSGKASSLIRIWTQHSCSGSHCLSTINAGRWSGCLRLPSSIVSLILKYQQSIAQAFIPGLIQVDSCAYRTRTQRSCCATLSRAPQKACAPAGARRSSCACTAASAGGPPQGSSAGAALWRMTRVALSFVHDQAWDRRRARPGRAACASCLRWWGTSVGACAVASAWPGLGSELERARESGVHSCLH